MENKAPIGLPEGTIRAILAILVVTGNVVYLLMYKNLPESLLGITGLIIGFYFGTRQGETIGQAKEIIATKNWQGADNSANETINR